MALAATLAAAVLSSGPAGAGFVRPPEPPVEDPAALRAEVEAFLDAEVPVHFAGVRSTDPPTERVVGALTTGEYTWGTFMRALAAYSDLRGKPRLDDRSVAEWVGRMGLIEARIGSRAFSQLYAALALRHFGAKLEDNAVWRSLGPEGQKGWRDLMDLGRIYDPHKQEVINLAENYLGVASRIATLEYEMGLLTDRTVVDGILDRAARPFTSGGLFADDAPPTGRFDRYSYEYVRYVWDAAGRCGRDDIRQALRPSIQTQTKLWWDLVLASDGYGYDWGRSLGVVSYLDTLEIAAFLAQNPEFRPAPLADLAAAFARAWRWLRRDYSDKRHLLSVFDYGRGDYAYITPDRDWQQTTGFLGKLAPAQATLFRVLEAEGVKHLPAYPSLPSVARFQEFRRDPSHVWGVWVVRQGPLQFALPLSTGYNAGTSDYLPSPHGLVGFAAPVEQLYPALTSFLELADGRTVVASGAASEVEPGADGRSLRAVWRELKEAKSPARAAGLADLGITSTVEWRIEGATLHRKETVAASRPLELRRLWLAVPSTGAQHHVSGLGGKREDVFDSADGQLRVALVAPPRCPVDISLRSPGDGPGVKGPRGAVPLHLELECRNTHLDPGQPFSWELALTVASEKEKP
jgi:hypothetical protein